MLKEVDMREANSFDSGFDIDLECSCVINEEEDGGDICRIITENIGIQISLADILFEKEGSGDAGSIVSFVSSSWNNSEEEQLEQIKKVFKFIHKVCCDEEIIAYEVYEPREKAVQTFHEMLNRNKINKWIKLFYSKENADDCSRIGLYKYIGETRSGEEISLMTEEGFFDYILHSSVGKIVQPGFNISQYKLSETEKIPFINELFSITENLYVIVSKIELENGKIRFDKYLTWDSVKL